MFIARDSLSANRLREEIPFFAPDLRVSLLPDWDVLPYDSFSPTPEVGGARVAGLAALLDGAPGITITTAQAALLPYAPPEFIAARAFLLQVGGKVRVSQLLERLNQGGYARVDRVLAAGEFAVCGGQIDIYPPEEAHPFRLVLLDDEIEQIRLFDPETQRSINQVDEIRMLPMSECDTSAAGIAVFRRAYAATFGRTWRSDDLPPGVEFYLPLFFENSGRLFDYLREDDAVLTHHDMRDNVAQFLRQARQRQKLVGVYEHRPALPVSALFMNENDFFTHLRRFAAVELEQTAADTVAPDVVESLRTAVSHKKLIDFIASFDGRVVLAVAGNGRRDALAAVLTAAGKPPQIADTFAACLSAPLSVVTQVLRGGFVLPESQLAVLTEKEIYATPPPLARHRQAAASAALLPDDIRPGDLVVHREYGVGRALGLKNLTIGGDAGEFLEIEYADSQRLWLPVTQLHWLQRHHGGATLSKMGGASWRKTMRRAARRAYDAAARMLDINARRVAARPSGIFPDEALLARFISRFAHEETPDQEKAAAAVLADMRVAKPMDRLVAADVGFGKTEIAMRAAAAAAFAGTQTAILAPTTLLAEQHYTTFSNRFADFPVRIGKLTRMTPAADRRALLAALANGDMDIVVGTHALLQKGVAYKRLGLAVIDEEHRFGVRHKERFKNMRADVDLLALSATPIPRTLSMALGGVRDISIISTPPSSRLPVKTLLAPFSRGAVVEACDRELLRGGQVFFIHNEIRSIEAMALRLGEWLPRARVLIAHGGMSATQLEGGMRKFLRREADILLCTTIVESGLDIANANTIVINRADRMGISRLHQLRGRVGRAGVQAYAYFLAPEDGVVTTAADKRLLAAEKHSALGGGFFLSMRDLELRGAGEILGERQSGDLEAVGYATYQNMINAAARRIRGEQELDTDIEATVRFAAAAMLPPTYVSSPNERMRYYRRLAACTADADIRELAAEWRDRFGDMPAAAELLAESHRVRLLARSAAAEEIRINKNGEAVFVFAPDPPCAARLLNRITVGDCLPLSPTSIKLPLRSAASVAQAREVRLFLRDLLAAPDAATQVDGHA